MTEHEFAKFVNFWEKVEEHRLEICDDCEHKAHSRADGKDYCVYNANGVIDGRPLDDMCACCNSGYCDKWHEGEHTDSEICPEADEERERLRKEAR